MEKLKFGLQKCFGLLGLSTSNGLESSAMKIFMLVLTVLIFCNSTLPTFGITTATKESTTLTKKPDHIPN